MRLTPFNTFGERAPARRARPGIAAPAGRAAALLCLAACLSCSSGTRTLIFAAGGDAAELEQYRRLLQDYRAVAPEEDWRLEALPRPRALQWRALSGQAAERVPAFDVIRVHSDWVPALAAAGRIQTLDDFFPAPALAAFGTCPDKLGRLGGALYAVPWSLEVTLLYANTDLLGPVAAVAPRNLSDLLRDAQWARRDALSRGLDVTGLLWPDRSDSRPLDSFVEAYARAGGDLSAVPELGRWGAGPAYDALRELDSIFRSGIAPRNAVMGLGKDEARRIFQAGGAAFMRNGSSAIRPLLGGHSALRGKFAVFPFPGVQGSPGPAALAGWLLAAGSAAASRREAAGLIAYLSSKDSQARLARRLNWIPSHFAAWEDLKGRGPFDLACLQAIRLAIPFGVSWPAVKGSADFMAKSRDLVRGALTGDLPLRRAAIRLSAHDGVN